MAPAITVPEEFLIDAELKALCDEASEEDLQALAEMHEDPTKDDQIEFYIYLCFLRFQKSRFEESEHLEQAIQRAEGWVAVTPVHHPDYNRRYSLFDMVTTWGHQHQSIKEEVETILEKLEREQSTMEIINEVISLENKFKQYGQLEDLEEAIKTMELAMSIAGGHVTPHMLVHLGDLLIQRFECTGSIDNMDRAISLTKNAIDATPHKNIELLDRLGLMLGIRSDERGSMNDVNEAISLANNAVDAASYDDPNRYVYLSNLGNHLGTRFKQTGLMEDLNQAIRAVSDAADKSPNNSPHRAKFLANLGTFLHWRFELLGLMDDLDRAIIVANNALDILPSCRPERAFVLSNLGNFLLGRFRRTRSMSDLNRAISVTSDALDITPDNNPRQGLILRNLSLFLFHRFCWTDSKDDLGRATSAATDAIDRTPHGHPSRAACLNNSSLLLGRRGVQTGSIDDLDRAINMSSEAVDATPHDHPSRVNSLYSLGFSYSLRYGQSNSMDDLDQGISSYIAGWNCITGAPSDRIQSAQFAANGLMWQQDWGKAYQLLHDATCLLPTISPRSLNHTDTQALLNGMVIFGLASSAAAVALQVGKAPSDALRLLELGRGVTASLLMDMRGDVTELQLKHPDLAEKFNHLRERLDSPARDTPVFVPDQLSSWELQMKQRREADEEFSKVIGEIQLQPGFSQFLQPPAVDDLMNAASQGPIIVVNITFFRSDAFLIQSGSIQVIVLSAMIEEELNKQVTCLQNKLDLSSLLEWLWNAICRPCLDALGFTDPVSDGNWPHVWWIPTGGLSQMPLHAAGIYSQASKETVLDRVISSYASSIKALLHGRKRNVQRSTCSQTSLVSSALIVAMQDTPGLGQEAHLQFANAEIDMLQSLCPKLQLTPSMPQRCKNKVLEQLPQCKLFHFAGHGRSDPNNPSQSCLLLEDWETNPLTVGAVRDSRLQDNPPFLAYLSACSTGANKATNLANEGIHLISAFQLAGFQHVVGTLWEVSDKHCVDVARILYKTLQEEGMTDEAVSRGLHRAVRALRDGLTEEDTQKRTATLARPKPEAQRVRDFLWVPYIHFGV